LLVRDLKKHFPTKGRHFFAAREMVQAVDGVSFAVMKGKTLGVVGESGCGKSTTARLLLHLIKPDAGDIIFDGEGVGAADGIGVRELRLQMQMVFQDSYSSLNPRATIASPSVRAPRSAARPAPRASTPTSCWSRSGCARRCSPGAIRTSCRAASASASTSPARWRSNRAC
jgi:peptide/nickel transport system ATP-binding protein